MTTQAPRHTLTAEVSPAGTPPAGRRNLRAADWLIRSRAASVRWLVARLWFGYGWLNAGYQKLWGSEKAVQAEALAGIDVAPAMTGPPGWTCSPPSPPSYAHTRGGSHEAEDTHHRPFGKYPHPERAVVSRPLG